MMAVSSIVFISSSLPYDKDRAGYVMHDGMGHASQEEPRKSLASMGGNDHQIPTLCLPGDDRCGIASGDVRAHRMARVQEFAGGRFDEFFRIALRTLPPRSGSQSIIGIVYSDRNESMKHAELGGIRKGMVRQPLRDSVGIVSILDGNEYLLNLASSSSDNQDRPGAVHEYTMGHAAQDNLGEAASSARADDDQIG